MRSLKSLPAERVHGDTMLVDSIMRRDVVTVRPDASVQDAARIMRAKRIGCLVVTRGGALVGILTERDLVSRVLADGSDATATPVESVMSAPVATIEPAAQVDAAVERMRELGFKRLVVVLGRELRGIVTVTDVAMARPELSKRFMDSWVKARWED